MHGSIFVFPAPTGRVTRAHVQTVHGSAGLQAVFTPLDIGTYCVQACLGSVQVAGSPFVVEAYDLRQIRISKFPSTTVVGQTFEIDGEFTHSSRRPDS